MGCVDGVVIFNDDSPIEMIRQLKPEVYVKGGDYTIDTINQSERRVVESYGGKIVIIPPIEGRSTTRTIARVLGGS